MEDIAVLAVDNVWTRVIVHALRRRFGAVTVILEDKEPVSLFLRRRIRRLGLLTVIGQLGFILFSRMRRRSYNGKEQEFLRRADLDATPIAADAIKVTSVNSPRTVEILKGLGPKVVVIFQTRILARRVLEAIPATFINLHTGITPQYRGLHGAYWALANGDPEHCGITVHRIDAGVDTGRIVAQLRVKPPPSANYFCYHWYQLTAALPLLTKAIEDCLAGKLVTHEATAETASRQYYHPTLWGYLWVGWRRNVW